MKLPTLDAIEVEIERRSLAAFVRRNWRIVEPDTEFVDNWHIDVIAQEVQDCITGAGDRNCLINVPPGTMKSLIVSVFAPAWMWGPHRKPSWRAIFASANPRVAVRDSIRCRDLVESSEYRARYKIEWRLASDQDAKSLFKNTRGGWRSAVSVNSKIVGERADALFIDDPIDPADANSETVRDACIEWYSQAFANRVTSPTKSTRLVIMQRLHELDLAGYLIKQGDFHHVCIAMEFEPGRAQNHPKDPRHEVGELLFPKRFPPAILAEEKRRLGSSGYAGQMQQRPVPATGGLFQRAWFRFWKPDGIAATGGSRPEGCDKGDARALPKVFDEIVASLDCNFKEAKDNDFVSLTIWGRKGTAKFLLYRFHKHVGIVGTLNALLDAHALFPKCNKWLVEDKANGSAVIELLKDKISGLIPVEPDGGKEARAAACAPQVEAGDVFLPDGVPWLGEYVGELASFPKGAHDDDVDSTSQVLNYMRASETSFAERFAVKARTGAISIPVPG